MSRVAANEWGPYDINVNIVLPLVMTDKLAEWGRENPEMFKKNLDEIPLGRYGDAQKDIGKVCVFLASYDAKYITGDTLFIQGGVGMKPSASGFLPQSSCIHWIKSFSTGRSPRVL